MSNIPIQPPKGTRDFLPEEMALRRKVIEAIRRCFVLYGFVEIDSPVFEYFELLSRKCGSEIEKEIYTFEDKAKRKLGLRFEFTSPLGRYYATNRDKLTKPFKRYAVGKVYRYENTQAGRYREFFQADADIIGSYGMEVELELLDLAVFTLERLGFGDYVIILNNRKILDGCVAAAGIGGDKKDPALRALDKFAKIGEKGVIKEFEENGISGDKYKSFMNFTGHATGNAGHSLKEFKKGFESLNIEGKIKTRALEGVEELLSLTDKAACAGLGHKIEYDPLLVRGLGYYTGPIFEIKSRDVNIGSFAAGGRYDNLVELYGARPEGACGISFGVERMIDIILQRDKEICGSLPPQVEMYLIYLSDNERDFAYKAAKSLRLKGIPTEMCVSGKGDISREIKYAVKKGIEYVGIIGEKEASEGKLSIKNLKTREERILTVEEIINLFPQYAFQKFYPQ